MGKVAYKLRKLGWYLGPDFMRIKGNLCEEAFAGDMHVGTVAEYKVRKSPKRFKATIVLPDVRIEYDHEWYLTPTEAREAVVLAYKQWLTRFTRKIKI